MGVRWTFTTPESHQANGKAEIKHKALKAALRSFCQESPTEWDEFLNAFTFAMNATDSYSLSGLAPAQVVYGRLPKMPLETLDDRIAVTSPELAFVKRWREARRFRNLLEARYYQDQVGSERKRSRLALVEYEVGDPVLLYSEQLPSGNNRPHRTGQDLG